MTEPPRRKPSAGASVLSTLAALAIAFSLAGDALARDPPNPPPQKAAKITALKKPKAAANKAAGNKAAGINQTRSAAIANNKVIANRSAAAAQPHRPVESAKA